MRKVRQISLSLPFFDWTLKTVIPTPTDWVSRLKSGTDGQDKHGVECALNELSSAPSLLSSSYSLLSRALSPQLLPNPARSATHGVLALAQSTLVADGGTHDGTLLADTSGRRGAKTGRQHSFPRSYKQMLRCWCMYVSIESGRVGRGEEWERRGEKSCIPGTPDSSTWRRTLNSSKTPARSAPPPCRNRPAGSSPGTARAGRAR